MRVEWKKMKLPEAFSVAGKALLLFLSLNAILAMTFFSLALYGMIALRLNLLLGLIFSVNLLTYLVFLKLRLAPESLRSFQPFLTFRNCAFFFLLLILVSGVIYYHVAVFPEMSFHSFREIPPVLRSGIAPERILPETASDIRLFENLIPPCSVEWRCRLAPDDFRAFAVKKNWSPEELADRNPRELFGRYLPEAPHISPEPLFFQSSFAGGRLFILYDGTTQTMYGRIAGR